MTPVAARITAVGTAVPTQSYSQRDILELFRIDDPRVRSMFLNGGISRRHLTLPPGETGRARRVETQGELLRKHLTTGVEMGCSAVEQCVKRAGADLSEVGHICCVTSTGFLTPGFSALLIKELGLARNCSRLDVVGMGCNAGLNALSAVSAWASLHPLGLAVMVCIEACSAAYVFDGTMRTSVVNSLFGDGAAAISVVSGPDESADGPALLRFGSYIIPEAIGAMGYEWDDEQGRFSFFLDREVPYLLGAHIEATIRQLLEGTGLRQCDITHWVVHSGGRKVIDSIRVNLGLTRHDVRHTTSVLHDYGNLSSGSFLFSYERLLNERVVGIGDHGVFVTMGPGSTIETALVRW